MSAKLMHSALYKFSSVYVKCHIYEYGVIHSYDRSVIHTFIYIYMYECVYKHKAIILQIIEHKHAYIIIYNAIKILASLS